MATLAIYSPGLSGGFLFDDFPNLEPLGALGGIKDWETFSSFVTSGFSGPLGRPVSLASFVLDANDWPASAARFKQTNLFVHMLTGVLLCWCTLNLLRLYGVDERKAQWAAVLNMAVWLLHPYMVSTTLYVVQRMAQLAVLFMLAGLTGYLHGRLLLRRNKFAAYVWMSISLVLGTILAVFSKENGALLPMLALVIEFCMPRQATAAKYSNDGFEVDWRWRAIFLWLPSAVVVFKLTREINFSPDIWPARAFNQMERLLTESRVIWEYLYHLFVPRIEGFGLFQDGYIISTGFLTPITTLPALLGLLTVVFIAIRIRRYAEFGPYISLAVLFFLTSHLVESTVVGLELYFEHRNYGAAVFLFLPLIMGGVWLAERGSQVLVFFVMSSVLTTLGFLTWQRSALWADNSALQRYWAIESPDSSRAQNYLAIQWFDSGQDDKGFVHLEEAMDRLPNSSLLSMQWLLQKTIRKQAEANDFEFVANRLTVQRFDAQAVLGVRMIVEFLVQSHSSNLERKQALRLLDRMAELPQFRAVSLFNRLEPYLRGLLLISLEQPDSAMVYLLESMRRYNDIGASLSMVAHMGAAGYSEDAMKLLVTAKELYLAQSGKTLKKPRGFYDAEISRLQEILQEDIRRFEK